MPDLIDDGHDWRNVYRNKSNGREVLECSGHDDGPCGVRKFRDTDGSWVIADRAPWVADEHVAAHVRSQS